MDTWAAVKLPAVAYPGIKPDTSTPVPLEQYPPSNCTVSSDGNPNLSTSVVVVSVTDTDGSAKSGCGLCF